jgi:AcrR family transcriptional regulator
MGFMGHSTTRSTGKERVLGAALRLFADRGFDRVTIRDIGDAAGFTNPALYRHYRGKEELGLDLYRRCYSRMVGAVQEAMTEERDNLEKLARYVPAVIAFYESAPSAMHYVDEHQVRFWPQLKHEFEPNTLSSMVTQWVRQGQEAGTIRTDTTVQALAALPLGLATQWTAMRSAGLCAAGDAVGIEAVVRSALSSSKTVGRD